jgi:hypothetical protein
MGVLDFSRLLGLLAQSPWIKYGCLGLRRCLLFFLDLDLDLDQRPVVQQGSIKKAVQVQDQVQVEVQNYNFV